MSNTAVGQLYKRVIDAVIEASRTDFEESGIDHRTLLSLQEKWQTCLSTGHRALFPWDPQPQAPQEPVVAPPVSQRSNAPAAVPTPSPTSAAPPQQSSPQRYGGVNIKQERHENNMPPLPLQASAYSSNPNYASQRAAHLVQQVQQQQFGNQGMSSMMAPGQQRPHGLTLPGQGSPQQLAQSTQSQLPQFKQEPRQAAVGLSQTDGAGDDRNVWTSVDASRIAVDGMIRRHAEEAALRLEAGGLLVPLDERYPSRNRKRKHRKQGTRASPHSSEPERTSYSAAGKSTERDSKRHGFDGADSEDEDDETGGVDAINSDLDDSDDDVVNGGIEGHTGNDVILCLYDKVQRTKNKWKCTLKDGVVTVEGKDYVFHKANGEFEW